MYKLYGFSNTTPKFQSVALRTQWVRPISSDPRTQLPELILNLSLIYRTAISIVTSPFKLLCYYGNATNSLLCNRTVMLLWKCNKVHRSCYQGNLICNNIHKKLRHSTLNQSLCSKTKNLLHNQHKCLNSKLDPSSLLDHSLKYF
jgi:hypothetical protein